MTMDDVIELVKQHLYRDDCGVERLAEESKRTVFCSVQSASRAEFFAAMQAGLKPSFIVQINPIEYDCEGIAIYHEKRYLIYRTYQKNMDVLELYLKEEVGIQNDLY